MDSEKLIIIGGEEWCSFPQLNVPAIRARIDSGAKSSSIHASNIVPFTKGGKPWVRFEIHPLLESPKIVIPMEFPVLAKRRIKNTGGVAERRLVIRTSLKMGDQEFEIDLTLANRDTMGFRMLLGREALNNRFLVNPAGSYLIRDYSAKQLGNLYKKVKQRTKGLKIALLASDPELYSNARLMEAAEERGHEIIFVKVEQCYLKMDLAKPEIKYRGDTDLNDVDVVIPRFKPGLTHYGCALVRQFITAGAFAVNDDMAIRNSRDKLYAAQLFTANGLPTPITCFGRSPLDTRGLIEMVNGAPLVIKLLENTHGTGVVLAETNSAAESMINAFKSLNTNILVQEFIKEAGGKHIRCFVVDGKVMASIERETLIGEFQGTADIIGNPTMIRITAEERKLVLKAVKISNLMVAGIDIIRSNRGPMLLKVSPSPGLEGIEGATGIDISSRIIQAIEAKIKFEQVPI